LLGELRGVLLEEQVGPLDAGPGVLRPELDGLAERVVGELVLRGEARGSRELVGRDGIVEVELVGVALLDRLVEQRLGADDVAERVAGLAERRAGRNGAPGGPWASLRG